jgi:hypothetical protein
VAAGSFEARAIPVTADADVGDTQSGAVDGNEFVDLTAQAVVEKISRWRP